MATGNTPFEVKNIIAEAVKWHIESSLTDGDPIADTFKNEYKLSYKLDRKSLSKYSKTVN